MSDGFMSPCENELATNVIFKKIIHINPATRFEDVDPGSSFNNPFMLRLFFKINMTQNEIT